MLASSGVVNPAINAGTIPNTGVAMAAHQRDRSIRAPLRLHRPTSHQQGMAVATTGQD